MQPKRVWPDTSRRGLGSQQRPHVWQRRWRRRVDQDEPAGRMRDRGSPRGRIPFRSDRVRSPPAWASGIAGRPTSPAGCRDHHKRGEIAPCLDPRRRAKRGVLPGGDFADSLPARASRCGSGEQESGPAESIAWGESTDWRGQGFPAAPIVSKSKCIYPRSNFPRMNTEIHFPWVGDEFFTAGKLRNNPPAVFQNPPPTIVYSGELQKADLEASHVLPQPTPRSI